MEPFTRENERLLKVSLSDSTVMAKTGSMVAYQGDISFEHAPAKLGKIFKKAVTGTPQTPMAVTGTGEVFLADQAQNVHLLTLDRERAWEALLRDKKRTGDDINLVLLGDEGPYVEARPADEVRAALDTLISD